MRKLSLLIYESYGFGRPAGEFRSVSYVLALLDRSRFTPLLAAPRRTAVLDQLAAGCDVDCVIVDAPDRLTRHGGRTLSDGPLGRAFTAAAVVRYSWPLLQLIRRRRIDVVCCWSLRALLLIGPIARVAGRRVVWVVNGALANRWLDALAFVLASRIVFQCEANMRDRYPRLVDWFGSKISLLKSGLDLDLLDEAERTDHDALRAELGVRPDVVNVAVLGQLCPPKGAHHLLEALGRLDAGTRRCMVYLVGEPLLDIYDGYREHLEQTAARLGLTDQVRFTGWRADALQVLSTMDVLVHPSLSEGMPRAVLEAMGLGKAVIATAVGCTREVIVDGENGFLVEPGDVDALADRLVRVVGDQALRTRLGQAARRTIHEGHAIAPEVRRFEDLVAGLVAASPR